MHFGSVSLSRCRREKDWRVWCTEREGEADKGSAARDDEGRAQRQVLWSSSANDFFTMNRLDCKRYPLFSRHALLRGKVR